ncbi:MAG: ABC transporter permease [Bradymonadia bacterium]
MGDKLGRSALIVSGGVVALVIIVGLIAPFIEYDPAEAVDYARRRLGPSGEHIFGTDDQGRDVAMRVFMGINAFFLPGIVAATITMSLGALTGALVGYARGPLQAVTLYGMQLIDTLPRLIFLILVCTILDPSMMLIAVVTGLLFIPTVARVIQRRVEALASEDYILAHIAHGFSTPRILLYHILWLQCRPLLIRQGAYVFGYVLFVETALSYLGDYGVQEPTPSWGNMVAQARDTGIEAYWAWMFPALAIVVAISGFLAFGNLVARRAEAVR